MKMVKKEGNQRREGFDITKTPLKYNRVSKYLRNILGITVDSRFFAISDDA